MQISNRILCFFLSLTLCPVLFVNLLISWCFFFFDFGVQKINQKNTWELNLIDHLREIIKVEEEDDSETNFQKVLSSALLFLRDKVVEHVGLFSS